MREQVYPGVYVIELSHSPRPIHGVSASTSDVIGADVISKFQLLIQQLPPRWSDDNQSDPGIALLELLAWLAESLAFRDGGVPKDTALAAARLAAASLDLLQKSPQPVESVVRRVRYFADSVVDDGDLSIAGIQPAPSHCLRLIRGSANSPYDAYNFHVFIDGIMAAAFQEVDGLDPESEPRNPIGRIQLRLRKLFGLRKYASVTLKRGYARSRALAAWMDEAQRGRGRQHSIVIRRLSGETFRVANARLKKIEADMNSSTDNYLIVSLEIKHKGLTPDA